MNHKNAARIRKHSPDLVSSQDRSIQNLDLRGHAKSRISSYITRAGVTWALFKIVDPNQTPTSAHQIIKFEQSHYEFDKGAIGHVRLGIFLSTAPMFVWTHTHHVLDTKYVPT